MLGQGLSRVLTSRLGFVLLACHRRGLPARPALPWVPGLRRKEGTEKTAHCPGASPQHASSLSSPGAASLPHCLGSGSRPWSKFRARREAIAVPKAPCQLGHGWGRSQDTLGCAGSRGCSVGGAGGGGVDGGCWQQPATQSLQVLRREASGACGHSLRWRGCPGGLSGGCCCTGGAARSLRMGSRAALGLCWARADECRAFCFVRECACACVRVCVQVHACSSVLCDATRFGARDLSSPAFPASGWHRGGRGRVTASQGYPSVCQEQGPP